MRNTPQVNRTADCFLNYPINVDQPEKVIGDIMRKGFDASPYFYRNCANLECFKDYAAELPNIDAYARDMIILPTYPGVPVEYIDNMCRELTKAAETRALVD